ncbi:L,D-transpeptidase family protein [Bacillus sp. BGMRC 2118]|nr:L,D-transpeptidase family protein [Bacillus sp. BGMRC 2118]
MIHITKRGETLESIALDYRTTVQVLMQENTISNPNIIYVGQPITIPGLPSPDSIPYTIWVSLSKKTLRLYNQYKLVKIYPVAIGRMLHQTPVGDFVIVNREPNPGGPFGKMWLSLSKIHYGIHGTNNPSSIGKAVSLGCIRMYNEDVIELSTIVPNGTGVFIRP